MTRRSEFGGKWTEEKLNALGKYLHAYTTIFHSNPAARHFRTVYVDAFAGTGKIVFPRASETSGSLFEIDNNPDAREYLKGSARLALEVRPAFHEFLFIERDPTRYRELSKLTEEFKNKSIHVQQSDANDYLLRWCVQTDWNKTRAVVFLDPYGAQVQWKLLEALAKTEGVDLWLLFPCMAMNRLLTKSGEVPKAWVDRLNELMGSEAWKQFYVETQQQGLFVDQAPAIEKQAGYEQIGELVLERLSTIFAKAIRRPLVLKNSRNSPLFLFCFAAANKKGAPTAVKIAQDIIGK